jgi:pyruvate formate lyase activating enzyme
MKRRFFYLIFLLVITFLVFIVHRQVALPLGDERVSRSEELFSEIQKIFPQASSYKLSLSKQEWFLVFDVQEKLVGKFILTQPFVHEQGYGGVVHLCIGVSPDGRIAGLVLTNHNETPDVVEFLKEKNFFESWTHLTVAQALSKRVDAVTGATETTQAVINSFQRRLSLIARNTPGVFMRIPGVMFSWKDCLAFCALVFSLFVFLRKETSKLWRLSLLMINVIVFGFLTAKTLSLSLFNGWLAQGMPWLDVTVLMFVLSVTIALVRNKNFYCTSVCPYGSFQELLGHIQKKKTILSYRHAQALRWLKVCYLLIIIGLVLGGAGVGLHLFEPFFTFTMVNVPAATLGIFIFFLFVSLFFHRFWCLFVCPTGTIFETFLEKNDNVKKAHVAMLVFFLFCTSMFVLAKGKVYKKMPAQATVAEVNAHQASFFKSLANGLVACELCPHRCVIKEGEFGFCRARKNINGKLYALTYGQPVALHVDPIEKKPFAHVYPGTRSFSLATAGCNLRCKFCQNWEISQLDADKVEGEYIAPEKVVAQAKASGTKTIAFTYTEPTIFYEYMLDIAKVAKAQGIACVMHSAGFVNEAPLRELSKYLLAANIDLKGFDEKFYTAFTGGHLETVLNTLKILKEEGVWIEITNLLIPGANDSDEMIENLCKWIKENLGAQTPVHFSRFYPMYKLVNLSPTPVATLRRAYTIAKKVGLEFVYIGNIPGTEGESTFCPACGKLLIKRTGYTILENYIIDGRCPICQYQIPGVWN